MSLIHYLTSAAGATASNTSLFVLFVLAFYIIYSLIFKRARKKKNFKQTIKSFVNDNLLRTPLGFIVMLLGLILLFAFNIPKYAIMMNDIELWKKIYDPETGILIWVHTLSETLIFIGFSIIFWPTILICSYKLFGNYDFKEKTYIWLGILLIILFKMILTIVGLMIHFHLLSYG